jgi:hypothetical protein
MEKEEEGEYDSDDHTACERWFVGVVFFWTITYYHCGIRFARIGLN